jgi:hypothetical protein
MRAKAAGGAAWVIVRCSDDKTQRTMQRRNNRGHDFAIFQPSIKSLIISTLPNNAIVAYRNLM